MMDIAHDIGKKYQKSGREMEKKAIDVMQQYGMKIKTPSDEEIAIWNDFKDEITPDVIDTFLSTDIYEKVTSAINE
jgi:TRAP-type C4-dicarboxylate transport system substrate-binding protein